MRTLSRFGGFLGWSLGLLGGLSSMAVPPVAAGAESPSIGEPNRVSVVRRSLRQDQGGWIVDYRIRNETASGIVIVPSELEAKSEGWVSNSRVDGHAVPRLAALTFRPGRRNSGIAEMIRSADGVPACRERLSLSIQADDALPPFSSESPQPLNPISLAPGASGLLRLHYEHDHAPGGAYDPLLGERTLAIRVGGETFHDVAPLDFEEYTAQPRNPWTEIPEERRDSSRFVSAPHSLHLEAHSLDTRVYRFPDRPARHGSRMRLSFWYLIAKGTLGECRVRLTQSNARSLRGGGFDERLTTVGQWTKVEWLVPIEYDAVSLGLDFRIISEAGVGEMWIDDVALDPIEPGHLAKGP